MLRAALLWLRVAAQILFLLAAGTHAYALATQKKTTAPIKKATPPQSIFADATSAVGLEFQHYNGMNGKFYLPEIMGAGAALFDYDNDGDLDVFFVQGAVLEPNDKPEKTLSPWREASAPKGKLYRNDLLIDKTGHRTLRFTDVTEQSRIHANGYGMGAAVGDINNDGWIDLYVCNLKSNQMFLNKGDGTFQDITRQTNTEAARWSTSAAFFDYDKDGWLDLFVCNYVDFSLTNSPVCYAKTSAIDYCSPSAFRPLPDRLFHNQGDGTFEDVSVVSGISKEYGSGLGVVTDDFNDDGWPDIYVANDGNPNQLWINQQNGKFTNQALLGGAAVNRDGKAEAGMGVDAGDFNGDGDEDIFITHLMEETNTLFVNVGKALFEDRTIAARLGLQTRRYTGFGTLWFDYDNDGWLDLLSANGAVQTLPEWVRQGDPYPFGQPNQLFHNTGKGEFTETSEAAGAAFQLLEVSRGAAFGDIDNDGDTDVVITNNNGKARLLLNQVGNRQHWLGVRLIGAKENRDMLGVRVEVMTVKKQTLRRRAHTDGGYCSAHDARVLFGLGAVERIETLRVYWPSGKIEEWKSPPLERYMIFKEGASTEKK
ncbi:MAG: CRTAC1 family protein [Acidobacteria bacterium]|nr:CRTAC1 family protein [Acidobacteriota bacterium]